MKIRGEDFILPIIVLIIVGGCIGNKYVDYNYQLKNKKLEVEKQKYIIGKQ